MKQNDYTQSAFGRPQQMQYSSAFGQPTARGGNYAPRPMTQDQMQQASPFGQPSYVASQPQGNAYVPPTPVSAPVRPTTEEANAAVEEMDKWVDAMNNTTGDVVKISTVMQIAGTMESCALALEKPEDWLPPERQKYCDDFRTRGGKLAKALRAYADVIKQLK